MAADQSKHQRRVAIEARVRVAVDVETRQPAPRTPRPHAGSNPSGVTLFVPASLVAGSSNKLYMLDNDTGYVVWTRTFEGALFPATTSACSGGVTAAPTRIVSGAAPTVSAATRASAGEGISRVIAPCSVSPARVLPGRPRGGGPGRGAAAAPAPGATGSGAPARSRRRDSRRTRWRPTAPGHSCQVGYAVSADGQLHVVGLQSGKDLQKPAAFVPPSSQLSNPVAVGTMMYSATSGNCAGCAEPCMPLSRRARQAGSVLSHERRQRGRCGCVLVGRQYHCSRRLALAASQKAGKRTQSSPSIRNTAAEGLVHTDHGRVRHRPHRLPARHEGRRCRRDKGRPRDSTRRGVAWRRGSRHSACGVTSSVCERRRESGRSVVDL